MLVITKGLVFLTEVEKNCECRMVLHLTDISTLLEDCLVTGSIRMYLLL